MIVPLITILAILLICLFLGLPVMAAMGITSVLSMLIFMGTSLIGQLSMIAYTQATSMNFLVAPLFILMSEFLARGGIAGDIFASLNRGLKRVKGGLAMSSVLASTIFAALCGSSPATAASIGRISVAEMVSRGYQKGFAVGPVAGGGTLGILIPPSITLVFYGILTETSISKLLIAGLLPGLLLSALMIVSILVRVRLNPALVGELPPEKLDSGDYNKDAYAVDLKEYRQLAAREEAAEKTSGKGRFSGLRKLLPSLILIFVVIGSLYSGIATPTESAAFGAVGAFLIVLFSKRMNKTIYVESMKATARMSAMIMGLIIAGFGLSFVVSFTGVASGIADVVVSSGANRWIVIIMVYVILFILGMFMDPASMTILTIPFVFPALMALGFDPIWFGVTSTVCVAIGMVTPPVGLNLFVLKSSTEVEMKHIITGAIPYVAVLMIGLIILSIFPGISLLLPSMM